MTTTISITVEDELAERIDAAVNGGNRSAFIADAVRDRLLERDLKAYELFIDSLDDEQRADLKAFEASEW